MAEVTVRGNVTQQIGRLEMEDYHGRVLRTFGMQFHVCQQPGPSSSFALGQFSGQTGPQILELKITL
jgi:hypothetical protein